MAMPLLRKPFGYTYKYVSLYIILANVLVYVLTSLEHELTLVLGLFLPYFGRYKMVWQPISYMFVHGSPAHLIFNMLAVLFFGMQVEKALGSREFLLFYLVCGVASGLLSLLTYLALGTWTLLVGASGAIYAVLFLFSVVYPKTTIFIWGLIPVPAPLLVVIYAGLALFNQVSGGKSGIAHLTHLYGFLAAWLYVAVRMGINPIKVWKNAYGR